MYKALIAKCRHPMPRRPLCNLKRISYIVGAQLSTGLKHFPDFREEQKLRCEFRRFSHLD